MKRCKLIVFAAGWAVSTLEALSLRTEPGESEKLLNKELAQFLRRRAWVRRQDFYEPDYHCLNLTYRVIYSTATTQTDC
jgi:hypothetical protein